MLSVCIPAFNCDIRKLADELLRQIQVGTEIIIIDDCSGDSFKKQFKDIKSENITIVLLEENSGRARIRNLFLQYARYDNLLFLDGDSQIVNNDFIKKYIDCIQKEYAVVCGGRIYPPKMGSNRYALHWKYGIFREYKTVVERNLHPNRSFMTNNFMIRKDVFQKHHFNDMINGYGHEDTLLGFELKKAGIDIKHINNPVLHGQLETNKMFLRKTVSGIANLLFILKEVNNDPEFIGEVSLLKTFFRWKKKVLYKIFLFIAPLFIPLISAILKMGFVSLRLFDLFKLLVLYRLYQKQNRGK